MTFRLLKEEDKTARRTLADAFEVVRKEFGIEMPERAEVAVAGIRLPSGKRTNGIRLNFPGLQCGVSLPASERFSAITEKGRVELDVQLLQNATAFLNGEVLLQDGREIRAITVVPTYLAYDPPRNYHYIVRVVIRMMKAVDFCYHRVLHGLPDEQLKHLPKTLIRQRRLDFSRIQEIGTPGSEASRSYRLPALKVIQYELERRNPSVKVSQQTVSDALAWAGLRPIRNRPRKAVRT